MHNIYGTVDSYFHGAPPLLLQYHNFITNDNNNMMRQRPKTERKQKKKKIPKPITIARIRAALAQPFYRCYCSPVVRVIYERHCCRTIITIIIAYRTPSRTCSESVIILLVSSRNNTIALYTRLIYIYMHTAYTLYIYIRVYDTIT